MTKKNINIHRCIALIMSALIPAIFMLFINVKNEAREIVFRNPIKEEEYDILKEIAISVVNGDYNSKTSTEQEINVSQTITSEKAVITVRNEKRHICLNATFPIKGGLVLKNTVVTGTIDLTNVEYEEKFDYTKEREDYIIQDIGFEISMTAILYVLIGWLPINEMKKRYKTDQRRHKFFVPSII